MTDMLTSILQPVLLAAGSLLATALVGLVAQFMKKNGIEMTAAQHDYFTKIVNQGISYAEEKGAGVPAGTAPFGSREKHDLAVTYIQGKLPEVTYAKASEAIHAELPGSGAGATAGDLKVDPLTGRPI